MAPTNTPLPTNVLIVAKIPEGVSEQQIIASVGRPQDVLQISYRSADLEGLGWAFVAFSSPDLAKAARERINGKTLPGVNGIPFVLDAVLGEGLYGNIRRYDEQDGPWKEARSPKGEIYYFHAVTRQTSWTKPLPEFPQVPPPPGRPPFGAAARPNMLGLAPPPPAVPPPPGSAVAAAQATVQAAMATASAANSQVHSSTAGGGGGGGKVGPVGANLFVYHIPNSWDDNILRQHFEHFGQILSCRIQKDPDGRARGFGFVSFDSADSAASAIAGMHGFPVEGKWLKVQLKKGDEQQL